MLSRSVILFAGHTCLLLVSAFMLSSCGEEKPKTAQAPTSTASDAPILRVGSITVHESDLAHYLKEQKAERTDPAMREAVLQDLGKHTQLVQAALDANLDQDPFVRAEIARILVSRYKTQVLFPKMKDISGPLPEARLRELYKTNESQFRSNEKRQVAVLWLNAGKDAQRIKQYEQKLATAREWYFNNSDLEKHPEQGFATLGVDYSEHQASRYKGGIVGWLEKEGGMDSWTKAVADIVFTLEKPGDVSAVIARNEGVFLVRYMAMSPAVLKPFESVSKELERTELNRLRKKAEADFMDNLEKLYPIQILTLPAAAK